MKIAIIISVSFVYSWFVGVADAAMQKYPHAFHFLVCYGVIELLYGFYKNIKFKIIVDGITKRTKPRRKGNRSRHR
jgi:hypothetical protein